MITANKIRFYILFAAAFGIAIVVAWFSKGVYEQLVEAPICFDYARSTGLPDVDALKFESVKTPDRYDREHSCTFTNTRTDEAINLVFAPQAVPSIANTFDGIILAGTFVASVFGGVWILGKLLILSGIPPKALFGSPKKDQQTPP